jgi:carboxynorspermidine decarboxylase
VLDVFESQGLRHAILDVSATCHMPDVLEMPYRPDLFLVDSAAPTSKTSPAVTLKGEHYHEATQSGAHLHRLGGPSCLAGDHIGDYAFHRPLEIGDTLVFDDMAHYTFVKSTLFNGVPHPDLALVKENGEIETVRRFGYEDFAGRLG